ncbi:MAG: hypothetical protein L0I24_18520 [Pseudonocardia sp.]|nr:hypothetical protein [Pseudonocardia sp.]
MIRTDLTCDTPATMRLTWRIDVHRRAAPQAEIFGKPILVTDHDGWSLDQVIDAYRSQEHLEAGFRQANDPHVVSFASSVSTRSSTSPGTPPTADLGNTPN